MTFRRGARLDPGQVSDRRGLGGRGLAIGGGGAGLVLALLYLLLGGSPADLVVTQPGAGVGAENPRLAEECRTGEDANRRQDCRIVGYTNSIQAYWSDTFAAAGERYQPADTVLFSDAVGTGCGSATSQVGPFYCPLDTSIYIDLGFFAVLESQFGAEGGPFAEAYVLAHEYGHHVQNLVGALQVEREQGAGGSAVRIELQADCYAGVWAGNATSTGFLEPVTSDQVDQALSAAAAVGDDRIQSQVQGQVTPETWTHGSSEQRREWFTVGYESADPARCDTFATP